MRIRVAALVVGLCAALGVFAGTASAGTGSGGITCTGSLAKGAASITCKSADGKTLSCNAAWTLRPLGLTVTCTLPDGTIKTFRWPS